ncbi:hypothetical protein [Pseudomonas rhodesiae]|uniref:hypothetical protein n=1 Tax=Pseudomonas rhodesiae TaxID=76760 RepID=UPI0020A09274|nr:hypothetical protein [Pseudomonas rhodesiae]MCP1515476.1 hypothetical protein [Pseudomonas rhodesiae]MDF9769214.1 hypothetical protein [Pseudomonas rhodesiae]
MLAIYPFEIVEALRSATLSMDSIMDYFFGHSKPVMGTLFHALLQSANKVPQSNSPTNRPGSLIAYRQGLAPPQVSGRTQSMPQRMPPVATERPYPIEATSVPGVSHVRDPRAASPTVAFEKHAKGEKGQATVGQMRYLVAGTGAFDTDRRETEVHPASPLKLKRNPVMSIMNHPPVNPTALTGTQGTLQLTREEVRVLHYYRALSEDDREAMRCLLNALLVSKSQLASSVQGAGQDNRPLPR